MKQVTLSSKEVSMFVEIQTFLMVFWSWGGSHSTDSKMKVLFYRFVRPFLGLRVG